MNESIEISSAQLFQDLPGDRPLLNTLDTGFLSKTCAMGMKRFSLTFFNTFKVHAVD
jgi:hypothetical protein